MVSVGYQSITTKVMRCICGTVCIASGRFTIIFYFWKTYIYVLLRVFISFSAISGLPYFFDLIGCPSTVYSPLFSHHPSHLCKEETLCRKMYIEVSNLKWKSFCCSNRLTEWFHEIHLILLNPSFLPRTDKR